MKGCPCHPFALSWRVTLCRGTHYGSLLDPPEGHLQDTFPDLDVRDLQPSVPGAQVEHLSQQVVDGRGVLSAVRALEDGLGNVPEDRLRSVADSFRELVQRERPEKLNVFGSKSPQAPCETSPIQTSSLASSRDLRVIVVLSEQSCA